MREVSTTQYAENGHRGRFRHVQHVRPNRGLYEKRAPHKRTGKFLQHSNMPEIIEIIIRK